MAQSKTTGQSRETEAQQLSEQIEALKKDIASISQILVDMGQSRTEAAVNDASQKVAHLRDRGEQHLQDAQATVKDLADQATNVVRDQPATAIGIAVGIGFIVGFLSGRK